MAYFIPPINLTLLHLFNMQKLVLGSKATSLLSALLLLGGCISGDPPTRWTELATQGSYAANFDPSGQLACIGSFTHGGSLWELSSNPARKFSWNHQQGEYSLLAGCAISGDGRFAVTAEQQQFVRWDTQSGQSTGFWSTPAEITDIRLSTEGSTALIGLADHTALYFDLVNGGARQILRHQARVRSVAISQDGLYAVTGTDDYKTTVWDLNSGEKLQQLSLGNVVDTVAISNDGQWVFSSGSLDQAVIWNRQTGEILHTLSTKHDFFSKRMSYLSAEFSGQSNQLLTGSASGLVQLWDVRSGKELRRWRIHKRAPYGPVDAGVYALAFTQGGYLAIGSNGFLNVLK